MIFKLDENLSPSLATLFSEAGHEAHSVTEQNLGGRPDSEVVGACRRERRVLITLDLDFGNIQMYPPVEHSGIVVLRLSTQAHFAVEAAVKRVIALSSTERLSGALWIVEEGQVRIRE